MPPLRNHMHEELASLTPILLVLFLRLLVSKLGRQMLGELEIQLVWFYFAGIWQL